MKGFVLDLIFSTLVWEYDKYKLEWLWSKSRERAEVCLLFEVLLNVVIIFTLREIELFVCKPLQISLRFSSIHRGWRLEAHLIIQLYDTFLIEAYVVFLLLGAQECPSCKIWQMENVLKNILSVPSLLNQTVWCRPAVIWWHIWWDIMMSFVFLWSFTRMFSRTFFLCANWFSSFL